MKAHIRHPVANLLKRPQICEVNWIDRNLETQLLYGDMVTILGQCDPFVYVAVEGQEIFSESGWTLYKGYVLKEALDPHGVFEKKGQDEKNLIALARSFLGSEYLWGGCSFPTLAKTEPLRGVDCSGLVHLVYKTLGKKLPRNAHDQFLKTKRTCVGEMVPGDLFFSSETGMDGRVDHVMMVSSNNYLIEAVMKEKVVREISFKEKFGSGLNFELSSQMVGTIALHPSTFLD